MQQTTIDIQPSALTDEELLRLANHFLITRELPKEWQLELVKRFDALMFKLDKYEPA